MWRFRPFMPKEQTGLEGRTVEIGNLKVQIRSAIAEGGFSCVYLAVHSGKQYALKHIICNDEESLDLVKKEISVMKSLKGHPNVVTLQAHAILDAGRTKEAFLVMEFCEKSLVNVLENRGASYFEEKQILLIFRDVCNAVFAMHCQSPPIAHRDLKAENVLLGSDGSWKLCDFGSTSTNHKRFERPEEMGVEEDNIRKHTTPAYRAPEMWDLFRRELINEKVDIWALGCLLYRICYFKSAFDGESKLQILNGNYRIPELPRYTSSVTDLIKDMLHATPDARPDITQVWFRVNEQLPIELRKQTPDRPMSMMVSETHQPNADAHSEGFPISAKRSPSMPRRPPPPPPSRDHVHNISPLHSSKETRHLAPSHGTLRTSHGGAVGAPLGGFWSTEHAQDSQVIEDSGPVFDDEPEREGTLKNRVRPPENQPSRAGYHRSNDQGNVLKRFDDGCSEGFEISFFPNDSVSSFENSNNSGVSSTKASRSKSAATFGNDAFNSFVADFDNSKIDSGKVQSGKEELQAEVDRLKGQLKQALLEKGEIASKYEKLSAICRSQRLEIQELKHTIAANSATDKDCSPAQQIQKSPGTWQSGTKQSEKIEGFVWELQQGMLAHGSSTPSPESKSWQAFADEQETPAASKSNQPKSVRTNGHRNKQTSNTNTASDAWGFGQDSFTATPTNSQLSKGSVQGSSQRFGDWNKVESKQSSQPAGWAGFEDP